MSSFYEDSDDLSVPQIGKKAPDFALLNERGKQWRLSDHLGSVTVLLFYPKDETLVCTRQMCSIRDNWSAYLESKASVVGISPGTVEEHLSFSQRHHLPVPLLVDVNREVTTAYGSHWLFPVSFTRAFVVIDPKGIVRFRNVMLRAFHPSNKSILASIRAV